MSERISTSVPSMASHSTLDSGLPRGAMTGTAAAGGSGVRLIQLLARLNLGFVALQAFSAGAFLSGYGPAVSLHAGVSIALQLGALVQAVTAVVVWRRRRVPAWVAGVSLGLLVMVFLQAGLGHSRRYWLHVPLGVGLFGGLMRQGSRLDALRRTTSEG